MLLRAMRYRQAKAVSCVHIVYQRSLAEEEEHIRQWIVSNEEGDASFVGLLLVELSLSYTPQISDGREKAFAYIEIKSFTCLLLPTDCMLSSYVHRSSHARSTAQRPQRRSS
jgi:hypothetical protein